MASLPRDHEAQLLARSGWVVALARSLARDASAAEDLAQEAWVAALERRPRELRPWLARVLANLARRARRGAERREEREHGAARAEAQPGTAEVVAFAAMQRDLVAHVVALDEPYRTTILWRYVEELSPRAIARRQGVPVRTVHTRLERGLARLRERLRGSGGGPEAWLGAFLALSPARLGVLGGLAMKTKVAAAVLVLVVLALGVWRRPWRASGGSKSDGSAPALAALDGADTQASVPDASLADPSVAPPVLDELGRAEPESARRARAGAHERDRVLRGVVVTTEGTPIAGAELAVFLPEAQGTRMLHERERADAVALAETRSDDDGRFAFELEPARVYDLVAEVRGRARVRVPNLYAGEEERVVVPLASVLQGCVTDAHGGAALAGVEVSGAPYWAARPGEVGPRTVTDEQDWYRFEGLPPCFLKLQVVGRGHVRASERAVIAEGVLQRLDFALVRGATVRGRVTDGETQAPIEGASVGLRHGFEAEIQVSATDADGRYELTGVSADDAELVVRAPGYGRYDLRVFHVPAGGLKQDFFLLRGRVARGRVVARDGTPIRGAELRFIARTPEALDVVTATSAADGRFEVRDLRADLRHSLLVRATGHAAALLDFPASEWDTHEVELGDVVLERPGAIAGRLLDAERRPLADRDVALSGEPDARDALAPMEGGEGYPGGNGLGLGHVLARTDERGRYVFSNLPAGTYHVSGPSRGSASLDRLTVELLEGEQLDDVDLSVGGTALSGRVVDSAGRACPGAHVQVFPPDADRLSWLVSVAADARGEFTLNGLEPGPYHVSASLGWDLVEAVQRDVPAGTRELVLVLPEAEVIAGRVVGPDSQPVPMAQLGLLEGEGDVLLLGSADREGRFSFRFPRGTRHTLVAWTASSGPGIDRFRGQAEHVSAGTSDLELVLSRP